MNHATADLPTPVSMMRLPRTAPKNAGANHSVVLATRSALRPANCPRSVEFLLPVVQYPDGTPRWEAPQFFNINFQSVLYHIQERRREILDAANHTQPAPDLYSGRLMLFVPDDSLSDGQRLLGPAATLISIICHPGNLGRLQQVSSRLKFLGRLPGQSAKPRPSGHRSEPGSMYCVGAR